MSPKLNYYSTLLLKTAIDSGITSPQELANIMGNAAVETKHFKTMHEDFHYRSANRLIAMVPSADNRFTRQQVEDAVASRDPQQIATVMYENRKDLQNTEPGDGWKFHGRGFFQYTGRYNYTQYGEKFGVDLVNSPDIAADPEMAAKLAVAYWKDKVPESKREDVRAAARIINGRDNGMSDRVAAANSWSKTITPELIKDIQSGKIAPDQFQNLSGDMQQQREEGAINNAELTLLFLSNPSHPDHALYQQALAHIGKLPPNSFTNAQECQNTAAYVACEAKANCLRQIDHVVLNTTKTGLFAVQGRLDDPAHHRLYVDKAQAASQPIEASTQQMNRETQQPQSQQQQPQPTREPRLSV